MRTLLPAAFRVVSWATALCLPAAALTGAAAQEAASTADRVANDPRVTAHQPYGLNLPPAVRNDKAVQYGRALRIPLAGHSDFWRIGIVNPTLKPVKAGDRIAIAFWARAERTEKGAPGRIGRVQLEATPVVRTIFEKSFEVGPEWKVYQVAGTADRDYAPGQLNAAMHLDVARQVLDIGPMFILNYGRPAA